MKGFIYIITNKVNGKQYVGQTIQNIKKRFDRHCQYYGSDAECKMAIKLAIHKYGRDNFEIKVLEECDPRLLDKREAYYISLYDTYNNGYNSTEGGIQGHKKLKVSDECQNDICDLYNEGFSLRELGREYNVDKQTIKHILELNNIELNKTRSYKLSSIEREQIIKLYNEGVSRKDIMKSFSISKSYLSQLINGYRRI